jgi:hypothetical protein
MPSCKPTIVAFVISALLAAAVHGDVVRIEIPPEKGAFKAAPNAELAQANCLICHSVEYVTSQPPMARKFWEASVKKMREKYGASIADEAAAKITDYLVRTYGTPDAPK